MPTKNFHTKDFLCYNVKKREEEKNATTPNENFKHTQPKEKSYRCRIVGGIENFRSHREKRFVRAGKKRSLESRTRLRDHEVERRREEQTFNQLRN